MGVFKQLMLVFLLFLLPIGCVGVGVNASPDGVPKVTTVGWPSSVSSSPACPPGTPPWLCGGPACPPGTPPWLCGGPACPAGTPPWLCGGPALPNSSMAAVVEEIHANAANTVRIFKVEDLAGRTWYLPQPPITVTEDPTARIAVNDVVTIEFTGHGSIIQRP